MADQPSVGRIVHFHPSASNGVGLDPDQAYAAVIVGVSDGAADGTSSSADLYVFPTPSTGDGHGFGAVVNDDDLDPEPDELADDATDEQRAEHEARTVPAGSWGWPPRV